MNVSNSNLNLPYKKHKVRLRGEGYVRAECGEMLSKANEPEGAGPRGRLKPSEGQRAINLLEFGLMASRTVRV